MPRGERPLEHGDDAIVQFASELRLLREKAGTPTYRELSVRAHYSVTTLSEAASGRKLPSLPVTLAYVAACGGDADDWETRWRTTAAELAAAKAGTARQNDGDPAPYVGLAAFQQEDAELFFGRDRLVADLLDRLRQTRFLAVVGSSGCGKSSLLRAGLAARLAAGRGTDGLPVVVFMPGQHPLEECAIQLAQFLGESPGALRDEFAADPRNLHRRIRQAAAGQQTGSEPVDVVLVVDQFEELFTVCADERERTRFVDALVTAATDPASRTRVVLGVRADFLGHCGQYPGLVAALRDAQVLMGAMSTDELRLAITGPAEQAGYRLETALVARLVADATRQPGMLPLVSHALLQTWLRRQGKVMTVAGYDAVGGIEHALARSAEATYRSMEPGQQEVAQQIFLRLTALGGGPDDTKRRIPRHELDHDDPNVASVLDKLTRARLVTVGHDSVEIAHEALIRHWPRLHDWLADDQDGHRLRHQLTGAAGEWERHERDEGLLYRGARLAAWQDRPLDRLNDTERAFLAAARRVAEREYRQGRRRLQLAVGGLCSAIVVVTVLAVFALAMAVRADDERMFAIGRQVAADARAQLQFDPELGLLLAREAYRLAPNEDTEAALRQASADSRIRATLRGPQNSRGHRDTMVGVAFSTDGKQLAISGQSELQAWDWATGEVTRAASRNVKSYAGTFQTTFSPDLRHVVETDPSGVVRLWNWADRTEPVLLLGPRDAVTSIAFSSNGQHVAVGGQDGTIRIVNTVGARYEPEVLVGHHGPVAGVAFGANGRGLASIGADGTLRVWDLLHIDDPVVLSTGDSKVRSVAFSSTGDQVATAHADGTIHVWDPATGEDETLPGSHAGAAESVAYSPNGYWIASAGADGTVRIWNADHDAAPAPVVLRGHRGIVRAVTFSPDGTLVASVGADGTAKVWDVDEVQDLTVLRGHDGPVSATASTSDGRWVASGGEDGTIRIRDVTRNRGIPAVIPGLGEPVLQLAFARKGGHLAAVDGKGVLRVWDTDDLSRPKAQRSLPSGPTGRVAFSPNGTQLAVTVDGNVHILTTTGEFVYELPYIPSAGMSAPALPIAWSPDGRYIAAATVDGVVLFWDLHQDKKVGVLRGQPGRIRSLAFSPDGTRLVSAGDDGLIHLWPMDVNAEPRVFGGHQGGAWSATFSLDGRRLVTSGNDATVRVWTTTGTSEPLVLDGFRASVQAVLPLAGNRYVTAHGDGTVRIWRCGACGSVDEVLDYASRHVSRELTAQERRTYLPSD